MNLFKSVDKRSKSVKLLDKYFIETYITFLIHFSTPIPYYTFIAFRKPVSNTSIHNLSKIS